ncbi:MAG: ubiquitin-activating E1 FCCH domain-containing protein [Alphaproteobacteria bacterium]
MPRVNPYIEAFNAGELSPRMEARVTFEKYQGAGAICENILCLPQGGWSRRPGTRFIAEVADSTCRHRLIPFEFSTVQAYILELGPGTLRFFRNQGRLEVEDTDAANANGSFASDITNWDDRSGSGSSIGHDSTNGRLSLTSNGTADAHAEQDVTVSSFFSAVEHVLRFRVHGAAGDTVNLRIGTASEGTQILEDKECSTGFHCVAFTPNAETFYIQFLHSKGKTLQIDDVSFIDNSVLEVATPWQEAQLPSLRYAQSADVMYFVTGGETPVYRLERYGNATWSLEEVLFLDGPFGDVNANATTLTPGAASGLGITVTASAKTGINGGAGFSTAADLGRVIRIKQSSGSKWGWGVITAVASATSITVDHKGDNNFPTTGQTQWRLGDWSVATGYPSVVAFNEQRLFLSGTTSEPQKFWLSKSADIENFAIDDGSENVGDADAIDFRFAAKKVNSIRWAVPRKRLLIGTVGQEWSVRSDGAFLTPLDISTKPESSFGSADLEPLEARNRLLFVQRAARKLFELNSTIESDGGEGFASFDLTVLSEHVLQGGVIEATYQQEPDSVVWCVRSDGQLATLTYQPDQQVVGWARQCLGGSYSGGAAVAESIAAIPGAAGADQFKDSTGRDEVWVIVKRTINGQTRRYIEMMEKGFDENEDLPAEAVYSDSCLTFDQPVAINAVTQAAPAVITTVVAHDLSEGDEITITRVQGMTELNGGSFIVGPVSDSTTFALKDLDGSDVDALNFIAYAGGGEIRKKVASVSGLSHLEGQTVKVWADGAIQPDRTVSDGALTLDGKAGCVTLGLGYTHHWKSLKLPFGARAGTGVGKIKRARSPIRLVVQSTAEGTLLAGPHEGRLNALVLRDATDLKDTPVSLASAEVEIPFDAGWDRDPRIVLKGDAPGPCTVLAIAPEMRTHDVK